MSSCLHRAYAGVGCRAQPQTRGKNALGHTARMCELVASVAQVHAMAQMDALESRFWRRVRDNRTSSVVVGRFYDATPWTASFGTLPLWQGLV